MNSPASHVQTPCKTMASVPLRGGNLARPFNLGVPPGLFLSPSRAFRRAPCSVRLSRNARSDRVRGLHVKTANRAVCMRTRDRRQTLWSVVRLSPSASLIHQLAHQFATDDANRNESGLVMRPGLCEAGAAGFLPSSPRPFPSFQVDNFTHWDGLIGSLVRIRESKRGSYAEKSKRL